MPPIMVEQGYIFIFAVHVEVLETNVFPWVKENIEIRLCLPTGRSAGTHGNGCARLVGRY